MQAWFNKFRWFLYWILDESARLLPGLRLCDPVSLENEVRRMLARGEITQEKYRILLFRVRRCQVGRGDLEILHRKALRGLDSQGKVALLGRDPAMARRLERLAQDRVCLEDARAAVVQVLEELRQDQEGFNQQAVQAGEKARLALPDEAASRWYLEQKQSWLERARMLEKRIGSLEGELRRLEILSGDMAAFETGLKSLESREYLVRLDVGFRESFLKIVDGGYK